MGQKHWWTRNLEDSVFPGRGRILFAIRWTFIISPFHFPSHFLWEIDALYFIDVNRVLQDTLELDYMSMEWLLVWVTDYYDSELKSGKYSQDGLILLNQQQILSDFTFILCCYLTMIRWGQFVNYGTLWHSCHCGERGPLRLAVHTSCEAQWNVSREGNGFGGFSQRS